MGNHHADCPWRIVVFGINSCYNGLKSNQSGAAGINTHSAARNCANMPSSTKTAHTNMNAAQLLAHLKAGARLTSRWRYGKRINNLKLSTNENLIVQHSNIQSLLKHGKIYSIPLSGDNYDYYLVTSLCRTI